MSTGVAAVKREVLVRSILPGKDHRLDRSIRLSSEPRAVS
jgi:hypothetical protein